MGHQIVDVGKRLFAENIAEPREAVCGEVVIFPGSGEKIAEQLLRIQKQIGPVAFCARGTISGVWNVTGQYGDITGMEGLFFAIDL